MVEAHHRQAGQAFKEVVTLMVRAQQASGLAHGRHEVLRLPHATGQAIAVANNQVLTYTSFHTPAEGGIQGLNFVPEVALEVGRTYDQGPTIFGLRPSDGSVIRAERLGELGTGVLRRPLDSSEVTALVDFASNPILRLGSLATALRRTNDEVTQRHRILTDQAVARERLTKELQAVRDAERRAAQAAAHIFFR